MGSSRGPQLGKQRWRARLGILRVNSVFTVSVFVDITSNTLYKCTATFRKNCTSIMHTVHVYIRTKVRKTLCPNFVRWWRGTKNICHSTVCRTCVLPAQRTVKLGLTEGGNQAKPLKYFEKKVVICEQWRPDVQKYWPTLWYTADANADEIDVCTQKCRVAVWSLLLPHRFSSETTGDV
jgi:hypothetical protein